MTMRNRIMLLSGAFALALVGAAQAQPCWNGPGPGYGPGYGQGYGPGYGQGYGAGGGYGQGMMARFAVIDANGDGVISADEAAANAESVFAAMDADDDGALTKEEFMAVRMGPQMGWNQARQNARQTAKADRFAVMDADGDGKVAKADFIAAAKARFQKADTDKDGKVSPWDFRAMRRNAW